MQQLTFVYTCIYVLCCTLFIQVVTMFINIDDLFACVFAIKSNQKRHKNCKFLSEVRCRCPHLNVRQIYQGSAYKRQKLAGINTSVRSFWPLIYRPMSCTTRTLERIPSYNSEQCYSPFNFCAYNMQDFCLVFLLYFFFI